MSIRYVVQQRKDPRDPAATPKYNLINKTFAKIDRDFLIKDMVKNTSLTANEVATGKNVQNGTQCSNICFQQFTFFFE